MSKEAEAVTKAVQEYEQRINEDPDAVATRALIQGLLVGTMMKEQAQGGMLRIADIEIGMDDEGNYERHFVLHMASGARIRVSCEVEK
jgi:hypothetical protein